MDVKSVSCHHTEFLVCSVTWASGEYRGSSVKDWMANLDYVVRSLPACKGWFSNTVLMLNKTWRRRSGALSSTCSGDMVGEGTNCESTFDRNINPPFTFLSLLSSPTPCFWQVCLSAPHLKPCDTTSNTIITFLHCKAGRVIIIYILWQHLLPCTRGLNFSKSSTKTESKATIKHEDEKLSRRVDRCLHRSTTLGNKTQGSLRFTGSYSCNPVPQHDRT